MSTSSSRSAYGPYGCPYHAATNIDSSCGLCQAWCEIELARKKLSLQSERHQLDKRLFKAERRKHHRDLMLREAQPSTVHAMMKELEEEALEWQARLQQEQRDHVQSNKQARKELQLKDEILQLTRSNFTQLQEQWIIKQQEWKAAFRRNEEAAGETSHESSQRGAVDTMKAEVATLQQQLVEQQELCANLQRQLDSSKKLKKQESKRIFKTKIDEQQQQHSDAIQELLLQREQERAALTKKINESEQSLEELQKGHELLERRLEDYKKMSTMSSQVIKASMEVKLEDAQLVHERIIKEMKEQHEMELEARQSPMETLNQNVARSLDIDTTLDQLKVEHETVLSERTKLHQQKMEQQQVAHETQQSTLLRQLEEAKQALATQQENYDISLENLHMEHKEAIGALEEKLVQQCEMHDTIMTELTRQMEQDQASLAARLAENDSKGKLETTAVTTELQKMVAELSLRVELEQAKNNELTEEIQQHEEIISHLQDVTIESERRLCQLQEMESEMKCLKENHKEVIDKLCKQVAELQEQQADDVEQDKSPNGVERFETKERELLLFHETTLEQLRTAHAQEIHQYELQIEDFNMHFMDNSSKMLKLESRVARFDDDLRALQSNHEREVQEYKREIGELHSERKKYTPGPVVSAAVEAQQSDVEIRKWTNKVLALEAQLKAKDREHQEALNDLAKENSAATTGVRALSSVEQTALAWETANLQDKVLQLQDQVDQYKADIEKLSQQPPSSHSENGDQDNSKLVFFKEQLDAMQRAQEEFSANHEEEMSEINNTLVRTATISTKLAVDIPIFHSQMELLEQQLMELAALKSTMSLPELPSQVEQSSTTTSTVSLLRNSRLPPLASVDEHGNHRVTEVELTSRSQRGKFTGWRNATTKLPNGHGIFRVDNGDIYEGEWKDGERHGYGVYTWYDGDLYTGPWENGKRHGHGVFVFSDGRIYDGHYVYGIREGKGVFTWPYGAKYEGEYSQDKRNGMGLYVYSDGRVYKGKYQDDRPHGFGTEFTKNGGILYEGMWQFGEFVGDENASLPGSVS